MEQSNGSSYVALRGDPGRVRRLKQFLHGPLFVRPNKKRSCFFNFLFVVSIFRFKINVNLNIFQITNIF